MRYSLCSYSLHRTVAAGQMDLFGYFRFCQEAGYTQLDPWNEHIKQAYDDNGFLAEVKAAAAETGLPMGCIAVDGAHIYEPTPEGRELNRARRYRWLEIAHELGAEQLRIDAGGRDQTLDEIFDVVVEGYKDIISRAQAQGVEIIMPLRRERPRLPIIAISGGVTNSKLYLDIAGKIGARRILPKPFTPKELIHLIEQVLAEERQPEPPA